MLEVKRHALLTAAAHRVVLAVVAHTAADVARGQVHRHVEVAGARMFVAVTLCNKSKAKRSCSCIYSPVEEGALEEAHFRNWG